VVYGLSSSLPFIRGDATFDSVVNISDAVYILSFLFLGGPAPPCEDAADTDDRGNIQIGDAIYILNFLFIGGARPPAPFPEPGTDPTDDTLSCRGL